MIKEVNYDTIVAFETTTKYDGKTTYGVLCDRTITPKEHYKDYIEYWCGSIKWAESGNWITEESEWQDKTTNTYYTADDTYVIEYCKSAYEDNPVPYLFMEGVQVDMTKHQEGLVKCEDFKAWVANYIQEHYWEDPECDYDDFDLG